jgi:hypothetical protein
MAVKEIELRPTMSDNAVPYENVSTAPIIYFDRTPAHVTLGASIEVELAVRALCPDLDGAVDVKLITSGRLRCSPIAARHLIAALNAALQLLEQQSHGSTAEASKLN